MWLLTPTAQADDHSAAAAQDASLRGIGVPAEALKKTQPAAGPKADPDAFTAWPWHLDAMRLFGAMRTQWRAVAGVGGLVYTGLDYSALRIVKRELGFKGADRALFDQLQEMERGGLTYLNRTLAQNNA